MTLSIGQWTMDPGSPLALVSLGLLGIALLLASITAWRRLFQRKRGRWLMVQVLNIAAVAAIAMLAVPPESTREATRKVVLQTEGADQASGSGSMAAELYVAPGAGEVDSERARYLLDIGQLPLQARGLAGIAVTGFGLSDEQWQGLPDELTVEFMSGEFMPVAAGGIADIAWTRNARLGEYLFVQGRRAESPESGSWQMSLMSPSGRLVDETRVAPGAVFSLRAVPRAPGSLTFTLESKAPDGRVFGEQIPVHVSRPPPARLIVVQSAPSFETRQLANWAADLGAEVVIFSKVSESRFISQALNLPDDRDDTFSAALLADNDFLVMDGRAVTGMDPSQLEVIGLAVAAGLGLMILADAELAEALPGFDAAFLQGFDLAPIPGPATEIVPAWPGANNEEALPVTGYAIGAARGTALVTDLSGRPLSLFKEFGLGRVAISTLRERYRWQTSGHSTTYTAYWARMMGHLARRDAGPQLIPEANTRLPLSRVRETVCALPVSQPLAVKISHAESGRETMLTLAANAMNTDRRCVQFWPGSAGWHQLELVDPQTGEVLDRGSRYVFSADEWLSVQRHLRQWATLNRASQSSMTSNDEPVTVRLPISALWPWLLLILSASALWLERKFDFED